MTKEVPFDHLEESSEETDDLKSKHLLALKVVVAQILKFLVPLFEDYSVDWIVKNCLTDPKRPTDPMVTTLNNESNQPGESHFIRDLVFRVNLPEEIHFSNILYNYFVVGFEPQSYETSDYSIEIRAVLYGIQTLLKENKYLELDTTKKMYKGVVPVACFWFCFLSKGGRSKIDFYYLSKGKEIIGTDEVKNFKPNESNSLLTVGIITIGNDFDMNSKNIYSFLYKLLRSKKPSQLVDLFEEYDFDVSKGEFEMFLTGIEEAALDKGRSEGRAEGIEIGEEKSTKKIYERMIKDGMPEEQARKYAYGYKAANLNEQTSDN